MMKGSFHPPWYELVKVIGPTFVLAKVFPSELEVFLLVKAVCPHILDRKSLPCPLERVALLVVEAWKAMTSSRCETRRP